MNFVSAVAQGYRVRANQYRIRGFIGDVHVRYASLQSEPQKIQNRDTDGNREVERERREAVKRRREIES